MPAIQVCIQLSGENGGGLIELSGGEGGSGEGRDGRTVREREARGGGGGRDEGREGRNTWVNEGRLEGRGKEARGGLEQAGRTVMGVA